MAPCAAFWDFKFAEASEHLRVLNWHPSHNDGQPVHSIALSNCQWNVESRTFTADIHHRHHGPIPFLQFSDAELAELEKEDGHLPNKRVIMLFSEGFVKVTSILCCSVADDGSEAEQQQIGGCDRVDDGQSSVNLLM